MSAYKGESPGKKLARLKYWESVRIVLGDSRFRAGPHMVLASRELGDVATLTAMGVPQEAIVAVDRDVDAIAGCATRFPRVVACLGDVQDVSHVHRGMRSILLDFCGEVTNETLRVVDRVRERALLPSYSFGMESVLGLCFQRGRERPIDSSRRRALQMSRAYQRGKKRDPVAFGPSDLSRAFAAMEFLAELREDVNPWVVTTLNYHSRTVNNAGVPMTMAAMVFMDLETIQTLVRAGRGGHFFEATYLSEFELRKQAVAEAERIAPRCPYGALNVARGTFLAWRAHATRGTYGGRDRRSA